MRHPPYDFDTYLVNVKTMRKIGQIFLDFSEKLNFSYIIASYFTSVNLQLRKSQLECLKLSLTAGWLFLHILQLVKKRLHDFFLSNLRVGCLH